MKHFIKLFALVSIVSFSLSCSIENDTERDTSIEIKNLKEEATILAKEYGVGIYINEDVWAQKTPSIEDIERIIVKHKSLAHTTKAPIYSNLEKPISKTAVNGGNDDLAYKPKPMKSGIENDEPISGSFSIDEALPSSWHNRLYVDVDWTWGGPMHEDEMEVEAYIEDIRTLYETPLRVSNLSYAFHGSAPNFSLWFDLYKADSYILRLIHRVTITYNHGNGVATLILN